jgi:capsular polysaccharide biosynthesis protein
MVHVQNSRLRLGDGILIKETITCSGLLEGLYKPVTSTVLGQLLPGQAYVRARPVFFEKNEVGDHLVAYHNELFNQLNCREVPIHLFQFRNALVFGQGSVVVGTKHLLHDSVAEFINHGLAPTGMTHGEESLDLHPARISRFLPGVSVLVKRPWYRNFGHWLVDLMPILPIIHREGVHVDRIIFGDVPAINLRAIMTRTATNLFPNADIIYASDDCHLQCEKLLYVEPVHIPPLFKHPLAIQASVDAARLIFPTAKERQGKRLYIARQNLGLRSISNIDKVLDLLMSNGFESLYPENLDFSEQIACFEAAEVVVGIKGAAMTSAMFCKAGTHALLLSPPNFVDPFFWDLLSPRGIHYSEIFCKSVGKVEGASDANFEVDLRLLRNFLDIL